MSTNSKYTEEDLKKFIESLEIPFDRLFVEKSPFGESVGYSLEDGREFDLAIESQDFENEIIEYLKNNGVAVRDL